MSPCTLVSMTPGVTVFACQLVPIVDTSTCYAYRAHLLPLQVFYTLVSCLGCHLDIASHYDRLIVLTL